MSNILYISQNESLNGLNKDKQVILNTVTMSLFIFRTDIKTKKKVKVVKPIFNNNPDIKNWSVDTEDIDNVLRIESNGNLRENDIITLMSSCGFHCETLTD